MKTNQRHIFLFFILSCIIGSQWSQAQDSTLVAQDSTNVVGESSFVLQDTTVVTNKESSQIVGEITYEAQEIDNLMEEKKTILTGRAQVKYQNMTLKAAKITVDWDNNLMTAEGVLDSVWTINTETGDSVRVEKLTGIPEFTESADVMTGEVMIYNFKTKKGRVLRGRTAFEDGFYSGQAVKLVKSKSLNVGDARFTSCDHDEPHFHFWSDKMKIEVNDKVIAKPIVMYIGNIPVLALPFAYFPIRKGRQSGIIMPRYGESTLEGRYLRGLGYYWAASEYWDVKGTVDYFENSGFMFRGDFRYNLRYKLSGRISGSWTHKDFELQGTKERRWDLSVSHQQDISPNTKFTVSGNFTSTGNFYREISANREQRMQQQIRSTAKLTHRLGTTGRAEITMNQTRNLDTDAVTELLPQITVSNRVANLIPQPKAPKGQEAEKKWYHAITIPYSVNAQLRRSRQQLNDSTRTENDAMGIDHSMSMYVSPSLFGWLKMQPSISYDVSMLDRQKEYYLDAESNTIQSRDKKGFFLLQTFNTSVSFNTKIYGLFQPRFLKNVMLRHVITPRVSFSYRPDFTEEWTGYYQTVVDTAGIEQRKDRFAGGLFGGTPAGESQSMSVSVNNVFQMKYGEGDNEKKLELFTMNFSSGYNWKLTQYKMSDLSTQIRANPSKAVSVDMRTTHSFYDTDSTGNRIHKLLMDDITFKDWRSIFRNNYLRMTYFSINLNLRLSGTAKSGGSSGDSGSPADSASADPLAVANLQSLQNVPGDRLDFNESVSGFDIPWNLTATLSYTDSRFNPQTPSKKFWIRTDLDFNITKNWKISYRSQWDLMEGKAVSQDFVFKRDLHCWEASIAWSPTGYNKRFYFKINVKSPMLRDLKYEKGTGRSGLTGMGLSNFY